MEIIGLALMSESSPKQTSQQEKLLQKAKNDYHCIKAICDHLPDGKLRTQVKHMQKIASRLLLYLKSHPDLLPAARRFIDYYQNRVAYILERYVELTQAGLSEDKHQALVNQIEDTLSICEKAYVQQLEQILSSQLLDIDAELSVMRKTIEADGIQAVSLSKAKEKEAGIC